jgi:hypothetical protein
MSEESSFDDFFLSGDTGDEDLIFEGLEVAKGHNKYLRKPRRQIEDREYFDPFHAERNSLQSPIDRASSPYLDEYSGVAGQYFKDIIIPRVPSRRSRARGHSVTDSEV